MVFQEMDFFFFFFFYLQLYFDFFVNKFLNDLGVQALHFTGGAINGQNRSLNCFVFFTDYGILLSHVMKVTFLSTDHILHVRAVMPTTGLVC